MLFDSENTHPTLVQKNKYLQNEISPRLKYLSDKERQIHDEEKKNTKHNTICIDTGNEGSIYKIVLCDKTTLCAKKFKSLKHYYYEYDMMRELNGIKNILFPIFVDNKHFILYYPFMEDGDLFDWIKNKKNNNIDMNDVKFFLHSLSETLLECKKRGFHHLDIKTENILIKKDTCGKIMSFFLIDWGLTQKMISGTFGYLCPEGLCGVYENAEKRDVWALGVTLFAFLTKHHAYKVIQNQFHYDSVSVQHYIQTKTRPHNKNAVTNFIKYASISKTKDILLTRSRGELVYFKKNDGYRPIFKANGMLHEDLVTFDELMGYINIGDCIIPHEQKSGYDMYFDIWENVFQKQNQKVLLTPQIKDILKGMLQINPTTRFSLAKVQDSIKLLK